MRSPQSKDHRRKARVAALVVGAAAALGFGLGGASPILAAPGGCDEWGCGMNGTQRTGVEPGGCDEWGCGGNGTALTGIVH